MWRCGGLTGDLEEGHFEVVETERDVRLLFGGADRDSGVDDFWWSARPSGYASGVELLNPQARVRFANTICQPTRSAGGSG